MEENGERNDENRDCVNDESSDKKSKTCNIQSENLNTDNMKSDGEIKFYDNLRTSIKTQENILKMTGMAKEKIKYANEISLDHLKLFKENSLKYGKYLKLIQEELSMISDLMKKIKQETKPE